MDKHIRFDAKNRTLYLLDQRKLPTATEFFPCRTTKDIIYALKEMVVRGAPAIGVTAAFGCALASFEVENLAENQYAPALLSLWDAIAKARPTAINLQWAVEQQKKLLATLQAPLSIIQQELCANAQRIEEEDIRICKAIGAHGATLIAPKSCIMTHCNAGALATAGYGTALGVIRAAFATKADISVIANETRPFLQGARLTAYELHQDGIPTTVVTDNSCALLMHKGLVSCVIVGADRIAANGDTANKIGTLGVALLANHYHIPFYVAAPRSTIDLALPRGEDIPIEQRTEREVTHIKDTRLVPDGVNVLNYAFDVTPNAYISAIITEVGVLKAPYTQSIRGAMEL